MDTTTVETMRSRIKAAPGYLDLEAGLRAAIAEAAPWHHTDLRLSEQEWIDKMLDAVADAAIEEALATAERGVAAVLPLTEVHVAPQGRNEALRAALAAAEADR